MCGPKNILLKYVRPLKRGFCLQTLTYHPQCSTALKLVKAKGCKFYDICYWGNKQQNQVIRINAKYHQMAFRPVLVHLPEILEDQITIGNPWSNGNWCDLEGQFWFINLCLISKYVLIFSQCLLVTELSRIPVYYV